MLLDLDVGHVAAATGPVRLIELTRVAVHEGNYRALRSRHDVADAVAVAERFRLVDTLVSPVHHDLLNIRP